MSLLQLENFNLHIGNKTICHHFNWTLERGDFCGILGINGSGKSTFLHCLANLNPHVQPVFLNGIPMNIWRRKDLAKTVGILFQDNEISFEQTVYEYCLTGRFPHLTRFESEDTYDKAIIEQALKTMDLLHLKTRRVSTLSGGEKRRAAIAALLIQEPEIYLLDEPTNHLDIAYQIKTLAYFKDLASSQNKAVVAIMHDVNLAARFCNKLLLLLDKTILAGDTQALLSENNLAGVYGLVFKRHTTPTQSYWLPEFD